MERAHHAFVQVAVHALEAEQRAPRGRRHVSLEAVALHRGLFQNRHRDVDVRDVHQSLVGDDPENREQRFARDALGFRAEVRDPAVLDEDDAEVADSVKQANHEVVLYDA